MNNAKRKTVILTDAIEAFEGKRVAVCVTSCPMDRNGFHTQINVTGTLERKKKTDSYRVVVSDGTYVYFVKLDVHSIVTAEDWTTKDGAVAVVFLKPKAFYGE
jgi:hypothetical protein